MNGEFRSAFGAVRKSEPSLRKRCSVSEPAMGVIAEAGGRAARRKAASVWLVFRETASLDVVSKTDGDITCYVAGH